MSTPENFVPYMQHGEATPQSVADTLRGAVELMGPNGENWIKGELRGGDGTFCMVGALEQAAPNYESYAEARDALKETIGGSIDRFNNGADNFGEVKAKIDLTLILAGQDPTPVYIPPFEVPPPPIIPPYVPPPFEPPPPPTFP